VEFSFRARGSPAATVPIIPHDRSAADAAIRRHYAGGTRQGTPRLDYA
jgi:hypothetical protein